MIIVTEMKNILSCYPVYLAEATKINSMVTGITRLQALKNLKTAIREKIKKR